MAKADATILRNDKIYREQWLAEAADKLRNYFTQCGETVPPNIRIAIGFPSTGRKGNRRGETWHSTASGDQTFEIFIRADEDDPKKVLGILVKELVHTLLPPDSGHGKEFKAKALKVGLQPPMRDAKPGVPLAALLEKMAEDLGPLPHKKLSLENDPLTAVAAPVVRPRKPRTALLRAHCDAPGCGYLVRVTQTHVEKVGPPHCPVHGAMTVDPPKGADIEPEAYDEAREPIKEVV